jgi:hypothetical protein
LKLKKIAKTKIASLEKFEQPGSYTHRRTYQNFLKCQNQDERFFEKGELDNTDVCIGTNFDRVSTFEHINW